MTDLKEAKKLFDLSKETSGYIPDYDNDIALQIDSYIFVIQTKDDFNNVIFAAKKKPTMPIKFVLHAFRLMCAVYGIDYIRVEGKVGRYSCLYKMFPNNVNNILQDTDVKDRGIYYIKI